MKNRSYFRFAALLLSACTSLAQTTQPIPITIDPTSRTNKQGMKGVFMTQQASAPGAPGAGKSIIWIKTDGTMHLRNNGGDVEIGSGGGGGGSGTVTSVDLTLPAIFTVSGNPVTGEGTLAATLANQNANRVWAGPTTGSAAAPAFRALVAADIPDLSSVYLVPNGNGSSLTAINATQLTSGTVPDARFPATLPALNGSALTAINATQLTSGTVPDARFPATLPALNGSALTAINATQLTSGTVPDARFPATLPALNGSALTAINATQLTSGTVPDARFPATLPALNGSALTAINATQLTSGTIPDARLHVDLQSFISAASWSTGTLNLTDAPMQLIKTGAAAGDQVFAIETDGGIVFQVLDNGVILGVGSSITGLNGSNISSGTVPAARGGAGTVSGILKANGSGAVSAASASTDYLGYTAEAGVASGTTTDIGAAAGMNVSITGTTTITAFDTVAAGIYRQGRFAGALTFTHNGTSLILPSGANITTAANDRFGAVSLGSGNWLVLWYQRADGTALAGGSGGGDASTNTSSSVDGEFVLFSGAGGKTLKRATGSGIARVNSGVLGTVSLGDGLSYASPTLSLNASYVNIDTGSDLYQIGDVLGGGNGTMISIDNGAQLVSIPVGGLSVAGTITGGGSGLTALNAGNLASGTVPSARGGAGTVSGILKANGSGSVSAAVSATDYAPATSGSAILKGNGSGGFSSAAAGTDYAAATSGSAILKGNGSGGFSSAAAGTDYAAATSGSAILKGNGSGGFSSATAGTDYVAPTKPTIDLGVAMATDDTSAGFVRIGLNNSGGVTQWDAVYLNGSSAWVIADANGSGTYPCRGLAATTQTTGQATTIVSRGTVRNDAWSWTPGGTIYLSTTAGGLTQTAPSTTGDKIQVIGYAIDADTMAVEIGGDYGTAP